MRVRLCAVENIHSDSPQAFHKCHGALLLRFPAFSIALYTAVFSRLWRSCRSLFPRCAWRARESLDWTRGTAPTPTPPIPRLVLLSSFYLSGWVANGSSHCYSYSTLQPPPPLPSSPPQESPYPSPLRALFHRQGCPRTTHCILYLAFFFYFSGHLLQLVKER